jgi:hypothetical protein
MADPYTTPIPGATGYESATLAAKTAYQNALARLNQQRGDTLRQYGYAGDINKDTGVVDNLRVDANLPYGQYQQERQQHADQYQEARDAAQARGLGKGGLAGQAVSRLRYGFGADDAQLGQGLSGAISGFQDQQNQAAYSRDSALYDAQLQAARDAIAAQQFDPANVGGLDVPEGPDWGSIIAGLLGGGDTNPGGSDNTGGNGKPKATPLSASQAFQLAAHQPKPKPKPVVSAIPHDMRPKPAPKAAPKPAPKPKATPKPAPKKKK